MRADTHKFYMKLAFFFATRSTCARRNVGCVMVDQRNHVLSTGYNGVASGQAHCRGGKKCPGADAKSGTQLDACYALHAEQNAFLQCRDVHSIETIYVTAFPCVTCTKLIMNTSCKHIVYTEPYPGGGQEIWPHKVTQIEMSMFYKD